MDKDDQRNLIRLCEKIYEHSRRVDNLVDYMLDYIEDNHNVMLCRGCARKLDQYTYNGEKTYYCGSCRDY